MFLHKAENKKVFVKNFIFNCLVLLQNALQHKLAPNIDLKYLQK